MSWRTAASALGVLGLAWLLWSALGWLVQDYGLAVAPLLQQAALFFLGLGLAERLISRLTGTSA
jgi:hypothetical protein